VIGPDPPRRGVVDRRWRECGEHHYGKSRNGPLNSRDPRAENYAMDQQVPPSPRDEEISSLSSLPGGWPSVASTTPQRERSKRRLVVGLVVGGLLLIGVIGSATDHSSSTKPPPGNYSDTGQTVTADECHAEGGQVVGDACYVP
jgi:hypothetical protein